MVHIFLKYYFHLDLGLGFLYFLWFMLKTNVRINSLESGEEMYIPISLCDDDKDWNSWFLNKTTAYGAFYILLRVVMVAKIFEVTDLLNI